MGTERGGGLGGTGGWGWSGEGLGGLSDFPGAGDGADIVGVGPVVVALDHGVEVGLLAVPIGWYGEGCGALLA